MTYILPPNNQWTQPNNGDTTGSLWATFNCNLSLKQGKIRGTRMITTSSTSSDDADLGLPVGFIKHDIGDGTANAKYYTAAGSYVFSSASGSQPSAFTQDATGGTPTTCNSSISDLAGFNEYLYVTTDSDVIYKLSNSGTWSNFTFTGLDDGYAHMLEPFANRIYITRDLARLNSIDTSDTEATSGTYTIYLQNVLSGGQQQNVITRPRASSEGIWIPTINATGGDGYVYFWNGVTADKYERSYRLDSAGALSCIIKDDTPYIVDTNGRLLVLNGGTFTEIARFPNFNRKLYTNSLGTTNQRWIHPNGMAIVNGKINILVNLGEYSNSTQNEENAPSGIWEYDPNIGLYHKHSLSYYDSAVGTVTDWGQSRIAFSTGAGNEAGAGGLTWIQNNSNSASRNGNLLAGFKYYSDATTTKYGIFYDDNNYGVQSASYIVTAKIPSNQIQESWRKLYVMHKKFITASDKVVVKFRTEEVPSTEGTITWTSTTVFQSTVDLSDYVVGDEVEILQGTGGGMCSHITDISESGGTYTVTVDETHTGASGTAIARFQKWTKAGVIQDVKSFGSVVLEDNSPWIQLKIFMLSTGANEIDYSILTHSPHEKFS